MSREVSAISSKVNENKEKLIPLKIAFLTHLHSLSSQGLTIFVSESDIELLKKVHSFGNEFLSENEKSIINDLYANNSSKFVSTDTEFPLDINTILPTLDICRRIKTIEDEIQTDTDHLSMLRGDIHSGCVTPIMGAIASVDASPESVMGTTYKKLEKLNEDQLDLHSIQVTVDD